MTDKEATRPPAIVIATGGAGRRMGGDKAGCALGDRRLVDHVIGWARRHSDCLALAVARPGPPDPSGLAQLGDSHPGAGPIAALHSAMVHAARAGRGDVVLVGCDTPFLPDDLIPRLAAALDPVRDRVGAALPRRGRRLHPLAGLWRCDAPDLAAWIAAGGRSPLGYAERRGLVLVDWADAGADPFANLNAPADLAAAEARLGPAT